MEVTNLGQTVVNLAVSLVYGVVTVLLSVATLYWIDHVIYRNIDFVQEMKNGNLSASIFYSVLLVFIGVIVATAIN